MSGTSITNEVFLGDTYPIRQRNILYWALCQRFRTQTQMVVIDLPSSIPTLFSTACGFNIFQFTSLSLINAIGPWCFNESKTDDNIFNTNYLIGGRDIDWHHRQSFCGGASSDLGAKKIIPIRTIDSLFGGLKSLGWLHINDQEHLLEIIAAAKYTITTHQPMMTVVLSQSNSASILKAFIAFCTSIDYAVYDNKGQQLLAESELNGINGSDIFALHKTEVLPASLLSKLQASSNAAPAPERAAFREKLDIALVAQTSQGVDILESLIRNQQQLFTPSMLLSKNVYEKETFDGVEYHWTGPDAQTSFILPLPHSGQFHLQFNLFSSQAVAREMQAYLTIDGQKPRPISIPENGTIQYDFCVAAESFKGFVNIHLNVNKVAYIPDSGKHLGIAIEDIKIFWQENLQ
ncbi:hypothetical protein [Shewanella youngdeokensis]|uniref:Uncharacterized protein n=1 Tax=Shewanella youngdeokensis TaxID=2999068 RepID=A0ABZ0K3G4_9GAMM|nr:hypothetical protein RGE70_05800 [Shewanella sp. DAU334]